MSKGVEINYEMLNIPQIAKLPDRLWRRLFEVAAIKDEFDGKDQYKEEHFWDIPIMAWILRVDEDSLREDLKQLTDMGFYADNPDDPEAIKLVERDIGYVYFLKNTHLTKIGMTNDLNRRKSQLESETKEKLTLLFYLCSKDYQKLEKELHQRFAHKRDHGEWFNLDIQDYEDVKANYKIYMDDDPS